MNLTANNYSVLGGHLTVYIVTESYTEETGIKVDLVPVDILEQVEKLDLEGPAGYGPGYYLPTS